jgi:hypothetical protein
MSVAPFKISVRVLPIFAKELHKVRVATDIPLGGCDGEKAVISILNLIEQMNPTEMSL